MPPTVTPTALTLIVDGEDMVFSLDYLPACREYIAYIEHPTEDAAHRAEIALKFTGGYSAWRGYDPENDTHYAMAAFPEAELPSFAR